MKARRPRLVHTSARTVYFLASKKTGATTFASSRFHALPYFSPLRKACLYDVMLLVRTDGRGTMTHSPTASERAE